MDRLRIGKKQLEFILSSSLSDKVRLFCSGFFDYPNYDNFMQRLESQQEFIKGQSGQVREDSGDDILLGLNRAALYAAMIGSPELASVKIATAKVNNELPYDKVVREVVCLHGHGSGIYGYEWGGNDIGQWADLCDEYKIAFDKISQKYKDESSGQKEHRAVRELANWLTGAFDYNGQIQSINSSYNTNLKEAVIVGQLSRDVRRQFGGMRSKLGSDLHNIKRFIGRSGHSQKRAFMEFERSRLNDRLRYISSLSDEGKQEFLEKENAFEIKKQKQWREKEIARIKHKYKKIIDKTRSEERRVVYEKRQDEEINNVIDDASGWIDYYGKRTLDGLLLDIVNTQKLLSRKIEGEKSLAEKAIDLHFRLDVGRKEWDDDNERYIHVDGSKYSNCIDWINDAPFGVIKRTHKRMVDGMPIDEIYKLAISEIIKEAVNDPDRIDIAMGQMFRDAEDEYGSGMSKIRGVLYLASKLSRYSDELSYSELESMLYKNTSGMEDLLETFSFSDVKKFVNSGSNLLLVPRLSRAAEKNGYELDVDQLIDLSRKVSIRREGYDAIEEVLASVLESFTLDEVMKAVDANVDLGILNEAKAFLSTKGINDFLVILDYASGVDRLFIDCREFSCAKSFPEDIGTADRAIEAMQKVRDKMLVMGDLSIIANCFPKEVKSIDQAIEAWQKIEDAGVYPGTLSAWRSLPLDAGWSIQRFIRCAKMVENSSMDVKSASKYIRNGRIDLDIIDEYPWLIYQYSRSSCGGVDVFPAKKSDNAKYKWCSDNSFVWLDGDWGRQTLGKIIFTRLQAGVDESVHDATQWLSAFQIPETAYDILGIKKRVEAGEENLDIEEFSMRLFDKNEEEKYLARIIGAPQSIRNRLNLSTKEQNMSRLFSAPEHVFVYSELVKILKNPEINFEEFREAIRKKTKDYYDNNIINSNGKNSGWRMSFDDFERKVSEALRNIPHIMQSSDENTERIGEIAQRLNQYGLNRRAYVDDATTWLVKHTVSPQASLTKAWASRASAIAEGVSDSAAEINNWANANSLIRGEERYLERNGIYIHDLKTTYAPFVKELTRCYGARTSANALVNYKNIHNPEKNLPASAIPVEVGGRKFTGEILAHDDPRGMTIGFDTGCCMTVDGVSESCIESGYRDSGAGFFAFYDDDGRINAQSYFFTHPSYPEVVVMDNIEANRGRDSDRIIEVYREFFKEYLKERFASDPNWQIRQVNVGTGYGEVAKTQVLKLESTEVVPNQLSSYSDAMEDQRILIRLSDKEIAEAREGNRSVIPGNSVEPNHSPTSFVSPLGINQLPILQSLESQLYPDVMRQYDDNDFAYRELTMPGVDRYSFLIKVQEDAASEASGYCLAYEDSSKADPNYQGKIVYVADFGIRPGARGGMTALKAFDELLRRIDEDGIERIEMDTRESTSYRFFTSEWGRRYLTRRGYNVVIHDETESFGDGERTRLISLEKKLG